MVISHHDPGENHLLPTDGAVDAGEKSLCGLKLPRLFFRYDEPRSDSCPWEKLSNAAFGRLSLGTLQNHAGVLEEQARGASHLRLPAERPGGLLHGHREPVSAAAVTHFHFHTFSSFPLIFYSIASPTSVEAWEQLTLSHVRGRVYTSMKTHACATFLSEILLQLKIRQWAYIKGDNECFT